MSTSKEGKQGVKKLNNIPGKQRAKKKRAEDSIKFQLNITEFNVIDDTILSKKYPIYFGKTPHIAIPRIQSNVDVTPNTGARLNSDFQDQNITANESNQMLKNTVFSRSLTDTFTENIQETTATKFSSSEHGSNVEVAKSKYFEKDISDTDNHTILSNNIVTELDVTKLKLTFKNLINHRSSTTSVDDKSSREQSVSKLPMIRGTSIEDDSKNTDVISHTQLGKEFHNDQVNVFKEKDNILLTLENRTLSACTVANDSRSDENLQTCETRNESSHVTSRADDIEKQTRLTAENNNELPVLADNSTTDVSITSRVDSFPPILTPATATVTAVGSSEESIIDTSQPGSRSQNDRRENYLNSTLEEKSSISEASTTLKVYIVEESPSLNKSSTLDECVSPKPHRKEQRVDIGRQSEENRSTQNSANQSLIENQEQTNENSTVEKETSNQDANICESEKNCDTSNSDSNVSIKRPKPKVRNKSVVKQEPLEIIRKPLSQHDGYDSDATMIYDEDERNDSRCLLVRGMDMNPLKSKQTQQLLRLKSKNGQPDEHELEKSPKTMECIESLYPSFRDENLDTSEDISSQVYSADDQESRPSMKESETDIAMENTCLEEKRNTPSVEKTKTINKIRICMKKNKNSISKHRHLKREKNKSSEIQLTASKWDQAISGPDNMILTDLTISRGIAKNSSERNSKSKKNRDRSSEKKQRNENKKRRDSQDMVLKNINKIFPKPRRKRSKDEDDLPTILPPKRRRQGKGHLTPDPKSDMDRIKHEFPHFNWLEKKYKDKGNVDTAVADISNHFNERSEQNVNSQNEEIGTTEECDAPCQNTDTLATQANQSSPFQDRIINSSENNTEGNTQSELDAEPPLNDLLTEEPCLNVVSRVHTDMTEEDEHMGEDEPALVIDEAGNNENSNPLHSSTEKVVTTSVSHVVCSSPARQACTNYLIDVSMTTASNMYDTSDARSGMSQNALNEKDSISADIDANCVQEKESASTEETVRCPIEQSSKTVCPNTSLVPNSISTYNTASVIASLSDSSTSVSPSGISAVASTTSSNVSSRYISDACVSNIKSFQKQGNVPIPSAPNITPSISPARNNVSTESPLALSPAQEPVTKKLKIDENTSGKNDEIPALFPLSSSCKQNKPIINRAKLFDPEIEGTYNEIKQLKRELAIKNQEVGRMMFSLKEKEEKLRSLLLSSPLGKTKHQTSDTEMNFASSSAVTTSTCTKQSPILTSSCSTPLTNVGTHLDFQKTPPPAHISRKENTKEILRTLAANPVPVDITTTCPFRSRRRHLSPPSRLRKDGYEGPIQVAHAQKPFDTPGTSLQIKTERSKSQGSESQTKAEVYTTRALSAPVQDRILGSPINLHHTSRPDSIGAINSARNDPNTVKLSSMHVPSSSRNDITSRQQPVDQVTDPPKIQSTLGQNVAVHHTKQNTETAIQQELNEALKRRQNFEQRPEQQDYQQFKISKPQAITNNPPRQIFQNPTVENIDTEYQKKTKYMHGMSPSIPITTLVSRPSVHTLSKSGQTPPYSGELINALQRTTQHVDMVNGRTMVNLSHAQLPHSVRLIGAATVPMNNNSRMNEPNRVLSNNLCHQQQIPTSHSAIRPQSVPRQQMVSVPTSVSQQLYHQKALKEGVKAYPPQIPLRIHQNLQSNPQVAVQALPNRLTSPQTLNQSQGQTPRMHQLVQAHTGQQMNGRQQEGFNPILDTKMKGMISGRSAQQQGNILTQQDGNAKAQHIFGSCIMCGKFSLYLCSTCQSIWYCSQQCQLKHWTTHQNDCKYSTGK